MGVDAWNTDTGAKERSRKARDKAARNGHAKRPAGDAGSIVAFRKKFIPRFWEDADPGSRVVKLVKERYAALQEATGSNSLQRDLLCQRCAFLTLRLESMESEAFDGGSFDSGVYVQALNSLLGLLKVLGLERPIKNVTDLKSYLKEREE